MKDITNEQLLFDRQESFNDIVACLAAQSNGIIGYEKRLEGNLKIINTINEECKRRGLDPAQYQEKE